jgi:hypothetical protein
MGRRLIILFFYLGLTESVSASSCCGQSPAQFTLLQLGQKLSVGYALTSLQTQGRVFDDPKEFFIWEDRSRQMYFHSLDLATEFLPRHQLFVRTAFVTTQFQLQGLQERSQHMADTQVGYSYEILPEYSYSPYKPKVFATLLLNAPTGLSIYDGGQITEGAGVTGHNQWGVGGGLTAFKTWQPWTLTLQSRVFQMIEKSFDQVQVSSFLDHATTLGVSYSDFLSGLIILNLSWNEITPRWSAPSARPESAIRSQGGQFVNLVFSFQKPWGENWVTGISYLDQTLLGPARQTLLNRSFIFNLNFNYF